MSRRRRKDSEHAADAIDHLRMLQVHLTRGGLEDALVRDAVSHRLEAAIDCLGKVSAELLDAEGGEDWPKIVGMRKILAHQYADLDEEILKDTIDNRLEAWFSWLTASTTPESLGKLAQMDNDDQRRWMGSVYSAK